MIAPRIFIGVGLVAVSVALILEAFAFHLSDRGRALLAAAWLVAMFCILGVTAAEVARG